MKSYMGYNQYGTIFQLMVTLSHFLYHYYIFPWNRYLPNDAASDHTPIYRHCAASRRDIPLAHELCYITT